LPVHRYRFPPQETEFRGGEDVHAVGGAKLGRVEDISIREGWVDIKKRRDAADLDPEALFAFSEISTSVLADALLRLGEYVADYGLESGRALSSGARPSHPAQTAHPRPATPGRGWTCSWH